MNRKRLIKELQSSQQLKAECPHCGGEFVLSKAIMFDASAPPPQEAVEKIDEKKEGFKQRAEGLKEQAAELRSMKCSATEGAEKKATEVGVGLVVEKIVTGWKAFPHHPFDCRSLFEPIDYVAFDGMTANSKVESIAFLDVKTGASKLNSNQRKIRDAINDGRVDYKEV